MRLTNLLTLGILLAALLYGQDAKKQFHGAEIFNAQCAGCHGQDGRAQTDMGKKVKAADLTSAAVQHMSASELSKTIKDGKDKMPAFGDKLSDDDVKAVVAYVQQIGNGQ